MRDLVGNWNTQQGEGVEITCRSGEEECIPLKICAFVFFANREVHQDAIQVKETPGRSRGDVLACRKVRDLVGNWNAQQEEVVGITRRSGEVGEKIEEIFGIDLASIKGTRSVDTAFKNPLEDGFCFSCI